MAEPFTLIASLASLGLGAAGTIAQVSASRNQAKAEQASAAAEADRIQRDRRRQMGAARAKFGASGATVEGSPLEVLGDLAAEAELDRQLTLYGGRTRAKTARDRGTASAIQGAGSLLGSAATMSHEGLFKGF